MDGIQGSLQGSSGSLSATGAKGQTNRKKSENVWQQEEMFANVQTQIKKNNKKTYNVNKKIECNDLQNIFILYPIE